MNARKWISIFFYANHSTQSHFTHDWLTEVHLHVFTDYIQWQGILFFFLQKQNVIQKCFYLQGMTFSSVHFPLISWSWFQRWQLGAGLLILVLHHRETIPSSSKYLFFEESFCSSGSNPKFFPLEEPFNTPNANTLALSEAVWHSANQNCVWTALSDIFKYSDCVGFFTSPTLYSMCSFWYCCRRVESILFYPDLITMDHVSGCSTGVVFRCDTIY